MPGGYKSGDVTQSGSFKVCFGRTGQFTFARFVFLWKCCVQYCGCIQTDLWLPYRAVIKGRQYPVAPVMAKHT